MIYTPIYRTLNSFLYFTCEIWSLKLIVLLCLKRVANFQKIEYNGGRKEGDDMTPEPEPRIDHHLDNQIGQEAYH